MTRRTFLAALAGLPLVGKLFAPAPVEAVLTDLTNTIIDAQVLGNQTFFVGKTGPYAGCINNDFVRHFDTIAEALDQASAGTSIIVAPGHTESFLVDKKDWNYIYGSNAAD